MYRCIDVYVYAYVYCMSKPRLLPIILMNPGSAPTSWTNPHPSFAEHRIFSVQVFWPWEEETWHQFWMLLFFSGHEWAHRFDFRESLQKRSLARPNRGSSCKSSLNHGTHCIDGQHPQMNSTHIEFVHNSKWKSMGYSMSTEHRDKSRPSRFSFDDLDSFRL